VAMSAKRGKLGAVSGGHDGQPVSGGTASCPQVSSLDLHDSPQYFPSPPLSPYSLETTQEKGGFICSEVVRRISVNGWRRLLAKEGHNGNSRLTLDIPIAISDHLASKTKEE